MDERLARNIRNLRSFEDLAQFESNARARQALDQEMSAAIHARSNELGRKLIAERTGVDLDDLSPAEEKIVEAISIYAGVKRRSGSNANRTLKQIKDHGLLGAAERAVARSKPTMGFETLAEEDQLGLTYEQIVLDHSDEFSPRALWFSRRTLKLPNDSEKPPATPITPIPARAEVLLTAAVDATESTRRNPAWSYNELVLALDLYIQYRIAPLSKDSAEIVELSRFLGELNRARNIGNAATYRNANGVYMKMMNFRRFDSAYLAEGKVGLTRGNKLEEKVWNEFSSNSAKRADAVASIRKLINSNVLIETERDAQRRHIPYWVFVCNPKKWAIDRFIAEGIRIDTWGVRRSDRERFAPGQLGIVRVGNDRRSIAEREGAPQLEAGIYALCMVESATFDGTGANDAFWSDGEAREPGWPTIKLRYLKTYLDHPLTIENLRAHAPQIDPLVLNGFQAASFPINEQDFHAILELLGGFDDADLIAEPAPTTTAKLAALEQRYLHASPEVKHRMSRKIERGPIGSLVKHANGFRCQLCEALGQNPIGFRKASGEPYVEAHHVMPVSSLEVGSLAASNVMTLCANHHREVHYGNVMIVVFDDLFHVTVNGRLLTLARYMAKNEMA